MGRRTEINRLAHKKKVDAKKKREQDTKATLKQKQKAIINKFNQQNQTDNE